MIQDTRQVKGLCTVDEFKLYRESLSEHLERLSPSDLRSRVRRARTLRDKYRDMHKRQRAGARGKMPDMHAKMFYDFTRTRRKAKVFENALERFERSLRALEMARRREEIKARRETARQRRQLDQEGRRLKAERAERESHLGRPQNETDPRHGFGAPPPRPGRSSKRVSAKAALGHFSSANRRFQARHDRHR